jgi:hypothetical protein
VTHASFAYQYDADSRRTQMTEADGGIVKRSAGAPGYGSRSQFRWES